MLKFLCTLFFCGLVLGCGGGGGSSGGGNAGAQPPAQNPPPRSVSVVDAIPRSGTSTRPAARVVTLSHPGFAGVQATSSGDCRLDASVERPLFDLSDPEFDALWTHTFDCSATAENDAVELILGFSTAGEAYEVRHAFSTGIATNAAVFVQDSVLVPGPSLETFVSGYLAQELIADLGLPAPLAALVEPSLNGLIASRLPNLNGLTIDGDVRYESVTYASLTPSGAPSDDLSGLIALPENAQVGDLKDRLIVLLHSTGVTPSELDPTDAWFLLAGVLASRGYLVIAPDNWGRGVTDAEVETYLMGARTAKNASDMIDRVLADPKYQALLSVGDPQKDLVGYSQGGHSAIALWSLLNGAVSSVHLGGGPYDLYATFRGVVEADANRCAGDPYCDLVGLETALSFVSQRILPGYLAYLDFGLTEGDVLDGNRFTDTFATGFLDSDVSTDALKTVLQADSYTSFAGIDQSHTTFVSYHSNFDRLVPSQNQIDLLGTLSAAQVDDRSAACNTSEFATIFALTDFVGINHALCGVVMIDRVIADFP